jgi:TM2 domain-containing membrane protein YozV
MSNAGRGSTSNVISAIASFFLPGLGQLVQGRILAALIFFLLSGFLWVVTGPLLGWLGHIWACIDAALWKGVRQQS